MTTRIDQEHLLKLNQPKHTLGDVANMFEGKDPEHVADILVELGHLEWVDDHRDTLKATRQGKREELVDGDFHLLVDLWRIRHPLLVKVAAAIGAEPNCDASSMRANAAARRRRHKEERKQQTVVREEELSRLSGIARVHRMIEDRKQQMRAEHGANESSCAEEIRWQTSLAFDAARKHSFDGGYPDFESELHLRHVFTVEEQLIAALRFEEAGRATREAAHIQPVSA